MSRFRLFQGILPLERSTLGSDIVAGIVLAALGIPEVMGYTKIAGTPIATAECVNDIETLSIWKLVLHLLGLRSDNWRIDPNLGGDSWRLRQAMNKPFWMDLVCGLQHLLPLLNNRLSLPRMQHRRC
jgi:hypothetical protein